MAAGLTPVERCVALLAGLSGDRLVARPSFFQLDNTRKARARGEPWHLIVHEDVLVFRYSASPGSSREPRGIENGSCADVVLSCSGSGELAPGHCGPGSRPGDAPAMPGTQAA